MKRFVPSLVLASVFVTLLTGCAGYQLGEVKPSIYSGVNNLHVHLFENKTLEPRLASLVTNAVLKEVQADGTYKVSSRANCDAVLVGTIRKIQKTQLRSVRTDTLRSEELRIYLYVDWRLEDPNTGEDLNKRVIAGEGPKDKNRGDDVYRVANQQVVGETIQFVDRSFQVGERNAYSVAAQDAATKLVSALANGW